MRRFRNAYTIYLFISGAFRLIIGISGAAESVYLATKVTDDPFKLMIIWTVFQATPLLFEIPTGVVADIYSRRLSIIIGMVLVGIGLVVEGLFPAFGVVLSSMVVGGIGLTFLSGARQAWITDEIGEERAGQAFLRGSQVSQIAYLVGLPVGAALGSIAIHLPLILAGVLFAMLALLLILIMPEVGFKPVPPAERDSWRTMFKTFGEGVRLVQGSSVLVVILLINLVLGLSSTGFDNLWTLHMLENITFPTVGELEPVVWLSGINAAVSVLSLLAIEMVRRKVNLGSQSSITRTLTFLSATTALCMLVFSLTESFWLAAAVYSASIALRMASGPVLDTWTNQNVGSSVRATVISMNNQLNSLGRIIGGPAVGAIGTTFSLPAAFVTTGLGRALAATLFARQITRAEEVSTTPEFR